MDAETLSRSDLEDYVLKNIDPSVDTKVSTAPFVALYKYNYGTLQWEYQKCEGILFIYTTGPRIYNLLLVNRINRTHFYQPISSNLNLQIEKNFLLYQTEEDNVYGLWFEDQGCLLQIYKSFSAAIEHSQKGTSQILTLLQDAEARYKQQVPMTPKNFKTNNRDKPSPSVANFFSSASCSGTPSSTQPVQESGTVIKKLMCNPKYSVENIEKQQRRMLNHGS